jgi:hypothetical protein
MSLIYERAIQGPSTHAFIIGVGAYPYAKPGASPFGPNTPPPLGNIRDLDSAPVGAKLFADWMIGHADDLPAPLASVHLALSAPSGASNTTTQYEWRQHLAVVGSDPRGGDAAVSATDGATIQQEGDDWAKRVQSIPGSIAVFYICGHGTAVPTRSVVLLSDVAGPNSKSPWQPFIDVQYLAGVMCRLQALKEGYVFVDACQEVITDVLLAEVDRTVGMGDSLRFFPQSVASPKNKVLLLVPAPMGQLTYDDGQAGGGRFTQVLVEALNRAGARNYTGAGQWGVPIEGLPRTLKLLYGLRGWPSDAFDPVAAKTLVTAIPLIRYPQPPMVQFAVILDRRKRSMRRAQSVCWIRLGNSWCCERTGPSNGSVVFGRAWVFATCRRRLTAVRTTIRRLKLPSIFRKCVSSLSLSIG